MRTSHRQVVTLPRSEFLDQSHIRTVCTRCSSQQTSALWSDLRPRGRKDPLLEEELKGPFTCAQSVQQAPRPGCRPARHHRRRGSRRIDSSEADQTTFDRSRRPVESFRSYVQGGRKGVLVNSRDICARTYAERRVRGAKRQRRGPCVRSCRPTAKAKRQRQSGRRPRRLDGRDPRERTAHLRVRSSSSLFAALAVVPYGKRPS
jgi:hypothetical protein